MPESIGLLSGTFGRFTEILPSTGRMSFLAIRDQAMDYLHHLPATQIENAKALKRLLGYLERTHQAIPCYALRSQLKLPNSSSPVERSNNLVTSRRQKHNGMSWSKHGSYALTALNAVVVNGGVQQWVRERTVPFKLVARAA